jgi:hypothetical protein
MRHGLRAAFWLGKGRVAHSLLTGSCGLPAVALEIWNLLSGAAGMPGIFVQSPTAYSLKNQTRQNEVREVRFPAWLSDHVV